LESIRNPAGKVLHQAMRVRRIPFPHQIRNAELGLGINCNPRPHIASALSDLIRWRILGFGVAKIPNLVALYMLRPNVANAAVVVGCAGRAEINEQFKYGVLADARHSDGRPNRVSLDESGYDLCAFRCAQAVHNANSLCLSGHASQGKIARSVVFWADDFPVCFRQTGQRASRKEL
jgi:hypothetical protein